MLVINDGEKHGALWIAKIFLYLTLSATGTFQNEALVCVPLL